MATVVVPSARRWLDDDSGTLAVGATGGMVSRANARELSLLVDVTGNEGANEELALSVQWSHNGVDFAPTETPDTFTALTASDPVVKTFAVRGPFYRVAWAITGDAGTDEVQSITVADATGGSIILEWEGLATAGSPITHNSTAANIQGALETRIFGAGNVVCAGGPLGTNPVTVTFAGDYAELDVAEMTATDNLTPAPATVTIATDTPGAGPAFTFSVSAHVT